MGTTRRETTTDKIEEFTPTITTEQIHRHIIRVNEVNPWFQIQVIWFGNSKVQLNKIYFLFIFLEFKLWIWKIYEQIANERGKINTVKINAPIRTDSTN